MTERKIAIGIVLLSAIVFITTVISYANITYPKVGRDFSYYIPHLVDAYLHFKVNGFVIQWYTPTFAGGLPAYPNPQDTQFTLAELLMPVLEPWKAALTASAIYILVGFLGAYYFLDRILGLSPLASALGSLFFNINGFIFVHTIEGHLGYQAFPLLPVLLIALFHRQLPAAFRGILAAIVIAIQVHSGGFYTLVIFGLSLSIVFPVLALWRPDIFSGIRLIPAFLWTVSLTVLLTASKMFAVYSFMGQFPRVDQDHYTTSLSDGLSTLGLQLANSTVILPVLKLSGGDPTTNLTRYIDFIQTLSGTKYGLWEFDSSLSPGLFLLLLAVPFFLIMKIRHGQLRVTRKQLIWLLLAVSSLWITTEFRFTNGWVYPLLQNLPVLQSLHVNLRFAAAYILPLALAGAWTFERLQRHLSPGLKITVFTILVGLTIISSLDYFLIAPTKGFSYLYDLQQSLVAYTNIKHGETYPIHSLEANDNYYEKNMVIRKNLLLNNASEYYPYEPIFGYQLENYHPQTHPGAVSDEKDGYYNLTNPSGLVYPKENNVSAFERIKIKDAKNFEIFINHGQPGWARPLIQYILDFAMTVSFAGILITLAGYLVFHGITLYRSFRTQA